MVLSPELTSMSSVVDYFIGKAGEVDKTQLDFFVLGPFVVFPLRSVSEAAEAGRNGQRTSRRFFVLRGTLLADL